MTGQGTELAGGALEPVEAFPVRRQILSAKHFHRHDSQEMIGGLRFRFETVLVPPRSAKNGATEPLLYAYVQDMMPPTPKFYYDVI